MNEENLFDKTFGSVFELAGMRSRLHEMKILKEYADEKAAGRKPFEVRRNDRKFRVGDIVRYLVVTKEGKFLPDHELGRHLYEITYVLFDYGLQSGYVAYGERKIS